MANRYYFEITDGPKPYYCFAYFDTEDHLGSYLFELEHVDVTVESEYGAEDDPYRIILCRIPLDQRDNFLHVVELLPELMNYVGNTDYDDYCMNFMKNAAAAAGKKRGARNLPLQ